MVPLAFGTQTGGSNIRPSAYCGIVGYKPSFGTIDRAGLKALAGSLDTIGVMGRTVADCALVVHSVSSRALPDFDSKLGTAPRIGFCRTSRWEDASPETQSLLEQTASTLARRGAPVRELALPEDFDRLYDEQPLISGFEAARALAPEHSAHPEQLSDRLREQIQMHWDMPRPDYADAMRHARACRQRFTEVLADIDVLLTPSAPGEAPQGIASTGNPLFNKNWTLLGAPCVTVPAGGGPQGLPLGVQLVGDYDQDERVLLCAEWVRQALA
jgi:Asp-tRNA(Asn)/Glu-tRNA(Gln) amidotransferase A subunit family amidase